MSSFYHNGSQEADLTDRRAGSASTGKSPDAFESAGTGDRAGFWRWSRNLSAHRYRELDRLNQIEQERQILELKNQDSLLEQLADKPSSSINEPVSSQTREQVPGQADLEESIISSATKDHDHDDPDTAGLPIEGDKHLQPDQGTNSANLAVVKPAPVSPLVSDSNARISLDTAPSRLTIERNPFTWQQYDDVSNPNDQITKASVKSSLKTSISSKQLVDFAFAQVPKSKRVLCLIVRNKVYRLNKANSYFYPTYYLFIQEIVDEQLCELESKLNLTGDEEAASRTLNSVDNSFSASSSISADMLFIGNNQTTSSSNNIQVANYGGGQNVLTKLAASSYSDNETETDNDRESEPSSSSRNRLHKGSSMYTNELEKSILSDQPGTTNISIGRDSPLVFPGRDDNNNHLDSGGSSSHRPHNENQRNPPITGMDSINASRANQHLVKLALAGNNDLGQLYKLKSSPSFAGESSKNVSIDVDSNDDDEDGSDSNEQVSNSGHSSSVTNAGAATSGSDEKTCSLDLFEDKLNPYSGTYGVLLTGRRRKKAKTYLIGLNEKGYTRKSSVCKLKSNVLGTQFNAIRRNLTDNEDSSTIASIIYETNVLGFKGPRKMRVFLGKDKNSDLSMKNITEAFKKDPSLFVELRNITPSWNIESQSYVLNFHGRVTQASVKNFQLVESNDRADTYTTLDDRALKQDKKTALADSDQSLGATDDRKGTDGFLDGFASKTPSMTGSRHQMNSYNNSIVMQFGRISDHEFTCDVTYPLSIIQAFSIALSSFDSKLACE